MFTQLLHEHFVQNALIAGAVVAIVSGAVGTFVVARGLSFAVHAISELGFTGAAAALVIGIDPVVGMISGSLLVGGILGVLSLRGSERDSAIGAFLAFGLGLGVLFLSLYQGYATEATNLLFGSIVGVDDNQVWTLVAVTALVSAALVAIYRPLLFSSVDPEVAGARGVPVRLLSVAIFLLLALTTAEAIQVVGVLLVLTLVITPAAAAQRLSPRPGTTLFLGIAIALVSTEGGILLSLAQPWPATFFISTISFAFYLAARLKRTLTLVASSWELDLGEDRNARSVVTVFGLITLFVILVGTTIVGIAANWPEHRTVSTGPQFTHPKTYGARVVEMRSTRCEAPAARNCSIVTVRLTGGPDRGKRTSFHFGDTGSDAHLSLGDSVLVSKNALPPGAQLNGVKLPPYSFSDFQRHGPLLWLLAVFAIVVVAAGRFSGLRALAGLTVSIGTVIFFIVPAITDGRPPIQVAAFGALGVMLATIPLVHGGGAKSLAACLGTAFALLLTLGLADLFSSLAHLSGLTSDEALYLQATTHVSVRGLLLAGMVVGALGVLADTTVTQASTVIALRRANPTLGWAALVAHATSVGRDHIAATVNTLVLAYTGAALPILVVFSLSGTSFSNAVNGEAVAGAIVATLVGSIGLIAAVPVTTALAALLAIQLPEKRLRGEHIHAH